MAVPVEVIPPNETFLDMLVQFEVIDEPLLELLLVARIMLRWYE
jgi:hypothetical protein